MAKFDDVIGIALGLVRKSVAGAPPIHMVRDTNGALVVVLPDNAVPEQRWSELGQELDSALKPYSPGARRVLLSASDVLEPADVFDSPDKVPLEGEPNTWLIDRLITNQDWLRPPLIAVPPLPVLVAFSVKGGVGRTTALAMLSWYLARQGKDVLVVDLDLEAPGIGELLLSEMPSYGLVDWLIESANTEDGEMSLDECIGISPIGDDTAGRVRVLPAYGLDSKAYIAKLGRIYAPSIDSEGVVIGLAERLAKLLHTINGLMERPDVVLMDVRAGLHDIGSAAVTRLGAEVLFFARNDSQNWWAYRQLFDHLKHARTVENGMGDDDDLRWRLKMVAAQTEPREDVKRGWVSASYDVWNEFYDDETAGGNPDFQPEVFDRFSEEAPHYPLFISHDPTVRSFVLNDVALRPDWSYVVGVFGDFFKGAEDRLWSTSAEKKDSQ
ncbi:AAA family ATPase [Burkholderia pseudomultivorans]|uniref:KGGVGR-motif variant AAA ATPase n=1 Tax=Burkholderia pseudomultivorans TaxID=1207504 RepID=UPI0028748A8A|nr:AAA family ATPase [Burkholderia pseudomultivorans]MDS0795383.1 AAA family ATPase [Burkholderia pseudomultivorans]